MYLKCLSLSSWDSRYVVFLVAKVASQKFVSHVITDKCLSTDLWYLSKYKCILRPNWFFNCSAKVLFVVSSSSDESLAGCHEKNSFCFRVVKKNQRHGIVGESRPTARSDFYRWEPWRKELDSSYSRMNRKTGEELTKTQVRLGWVSVELVEFYFSHIKWPITAHQSNVASESAVDNLFRAVIA